MIRPRPIAIAAVAVVAVLLSGCGGSSPPPTVSGLVACGPEHPGWYLYKPMNYCYPASHFVGVFSGPY